jgi:hypothetical protein
MDDLVAFVRQQLDARMAQLDEDERVARNAKRMRMLANFADPNRVLAEVEQGRAEVEAKRRILDEHDSYGGYGERCQTCRDPNDDLAAGAPLPCPTVRLLALPYAGRPGWREEWAV